MSEREHSRFGGSIAKRIIHCPASVPLADTVPPEPESKYAAEGTAAHELAAHCLVEGERDARPHVGLSLPFGEAGRSGFIVTADMASAVNVYLKAAYAAIDADPVCEYYVEARFGLPLANAADGEAYGTADLVVFNRSARLLTVPDYKHGAGVAVDVEGNEQALYYASGAALEHPEWEFDDVELMIVQPRAYDGDEGVKRAIVPRAALFDFVALFDRAVGRAKEAETQLLTEGRIAADMFEIGEWCRWCPVAGAGACPAKRAAAVSGLSLPVPLEQITTEYLPAPETFNLESLVRIRAALELLDGWAGQIADYMEGLARAGHAVPGFKLVEKMARRQWIAEDQDVADHLFMTYGVDPDDILPRRLVTITEAEKLLKLACPDTAAFKQAKDDLSLRFTVKDSSGITLVPVSDKREAVNAVATALTGVNL